MAAAAGAGGAAGGAGGGVASAPTALHGGRTAPPANPDMVFLFDVDGTLTIPRGPVAQEMVSALYALRERGWVAVVGGSDQRKILEQLGAGAMSFFDFLFSENGLVAVRDGSEFARRQLTHHFSEADRNSFESFCWDHIRGLVLPKKCSHHVETRAGMWNVSPIGRDCTQDERKAFEQYDHKHKIREQMVALLKPKFAHLNLSFAIGGEISFDAYPKGWDKTYCLQFLSAYKHVHFFGDKTYAGGNDYDIYMSLRTVGHCTTGPHVTIKLIEHVFTERAAANGAETAARDALNAVFAPTAARPEDAKAATDAVVGFLNYFFTK